MIVPVAFLALLLAGATRQEEALPFDAPQVQLPLDSPPFQRLLDLDGDGDLDAVGTRPRRPSSAPELLEGFELALWENDGNGRFHEIRRERHVFPARWYTAPVLPLAVGDWSGDGLTDFVVAAGHELHRYRSTPDEAEPFEHRIEVLEESVQDIAVADFDGDGRVDVALLVGDEPRYIGDRAGCAVRVLWPERRLRARAPTEARLEWRSRLLVLESDGDGLPDLLAYHGDRATTLELRGRELLPGIDLRFAAYGTMLAGGDIDGDGDEDLVSFSTARQCQVARRTGPRAWHLESEYAGGPAEYLVDIDGDGDLDGVCCSGGGGGATYPTLRFHSTFEIALNENGLFRPAFQMPGLGSRSLAGAADVDGDGDVDLVAGRCVYFQSAPWGSLTRPSLGITSAAELFDADGDGDEEPWRSAETPAGLQLTSYRNQGDGTFAWQPMQMEAPGAGWAVTGVRLHGDFDGDGDEDLIRGVRPASNPYASPSFLGLWRNRGGGDLAYAGPCLLPDASAPYPLPSGAATSFLRADLEQDGDLDLVFVPGRYRSQTYRNDGNGSFVSDTVLVDPNEGASAFADFDGDGRLDKLVHDGVSPIYLRRGLAVVTGALFGQPESLFHGVSGPPEAYALADLDGDGLLDLGTVLGGSARLWLNRLATGGGFLETTPTLDTFTQSEARLHALEVDQDGRVDLLIGPTDTPERPFRYYRQRSDAGPLLGPDAFEAPLELVLPGVVRTTRFSGSTVTEVVLLATDLDGDGDPDLAGEYAVRNRAFEGRSAGARRQYGSATAGTGGHLPTLGAVGPFAPRRTVEFRLSGASTPNAWLGLSSSAAYRVELGVRLLIDTSPAAGFILFPLTSAGSGPGGVHAAFPLPIALAWIGRSLYAQAFVAEPDLPGGWTATQGLQLTIGARR